MPLGRGPPPEPVADSPDSPPPRDFAFTLADPQGAGTAPHRVLARHGAVPFPMACARGVRYSMIFLLVDSLRLLSYVVLRKFWECVHEALREGAGWNATLSAAIIYS